MATNQPVTVMLSESEMKTVIAALQLYGTVMADNDLCPRTYLMFLIKGWQEDRNHLINELDHAAENWTLEPDDPVFGIQGTLKNLRACALANKLLRSAQSHERSLNGSPRVEPLRNLLQPNFNVDDQGRRYRDISDPPFPGFSRYVTIDPQPEPPEEYFNDPDTSDEEAASEEEEETTNANELDHLRNLDEPAANPQEPSEELDEERMEISNDDPLEQQVSSLLSNIREQVNSLYRTS